MGKIDKLAEKFKNHISIPWNARAADAQRVIFCVYEASSERTLRAKMVEFELAATDSGHQWTLFDLTDTFAQWMGSQKYARSYFTNPSRLHALPLQNYRDWIKKRFIDTIQSQARENTVVGLMGVGALFGILKVHEVVKDLAPLVEGRLVVFFPGTVEETTYRLFDAYDGTEYKAVCIA